MFWPLGTACASKCLLLDFIIVVLFSEKPLNLWLIMKQFPLRFKLSALNVRNHEPTPVSSCHARGSEFAAVVLISFVLCAHRWEQP